MHTKIWMEDFMKMKKDEMITKELLDLFEETFDKVTGFYLDQKSSLFETIESLTSEEVSRTRGNTNTTIAAQLNHILFYIIVLQEYITDKRTGKTDWDESWILKTVDDEEWIVMKNELRKEYAKLRDFVKNIETWNNEDDFSGVVSILVHCAYHLGSVRQLIKV